MRVAGGRRRRGGLRIAPGEKQDQEEPLHEVATRFAATSVE
jgi:hypothetical protein